MPASRALSSFLELLTEPMRARILSSPALLDLLAQSLTRAGALDDGLAGYLAERFPAAGKLEQALAAWCTEDLRLCHGCAQGEPEAVAAFTARLRPVIHGTLVHLRIAEPLREELEQQLMVQLVVGDEGRPPLIRSYLGLGKLEHWVRVVVGRHGRKALGREKQSVPDAELASRLADHRGASELAGAEEVYRQVFREAFRQSMEALAPRQATLVRQRYSDGLTLQELGAIYRVHHETARRWLDQVHRTLLAETRLRMAARLALGEQELDTVLRLIGGDLDLTLRTFFAREA